MNNLRLPNVNQKERHEMKTIFRYHHLGIPSRKKVSGMVEIRHLKIHATDHASNPFGIQWMLYGKNCKVPDLVRKVPHAAFEVDDLAKALKERKVIIKPNSPSPEVLVAFIEEAGAPVELLQFTNKPANARHRTNQKRNTQK
jgi:hypothetical protein